MFGKTLKNYAVFTNSTQSLLGKKCIVYNCTIQYDSSLEFPYKIYCNSAQLSNTIPSIV